MVFSTIFAILVTVICLVEGTINAVVIGAIVRGRLWKRSSMYILSVGNMINDQFLLLCHLMYLVPAVLEQSYLSKNGTNGPFPNLMNWSLLSGWYVTSFTLAYVAVTRFFVIVLHQPNMSRSLAVLSMFFIFLLSWIMSYIAQFEFLCCELIFNPFNYGYGYVSNGNLTNYSNQYFDFPLNNAVSVITVGCYMVIIGKLFYMRRGFKLKTNQINGAREYIYAFQFFLISLCYVIDWISTRVNGYIFGDHLEWYSVGVFLLLFNCGANGIIYLWRNKEVRHQIFQTALPSHGVYSTNTHCSTNPNNSTVNKINSFTKEP